VSARLHSLAKLWFERWLVGLCQCVQCGWGFFLFFAGGRKKQNKFIQFAPTYQRAKSFLILILSISYLSGRLSFYTCCQRSGALQRAGF